MVERANWSLGEGNKSNTGQRQRNWWKRFSVVIPTEIGMPTFRTTEVDVAKNDEALEINLELLKEKREQAAIREKKEEANGKKYLQTPKLKCKLQARRLGVPEQRSKPCRRY
ncbi:hypothetical protein Tco_0156756 [Tanacetum coccineum]